MKVCIAAALWVAFFMSKSISIEVESPYPYVWCQIILQETARRMEEPSKNGYFIPGRSFISEIKISISHINEVVGIADGLLLLIPEISNFLTEGKNKPLFNAWLSLKTDLGDPIQVDKVFRNFLIKCLRIECSLFM